MSFKDCIAEIKKASGLNLSDAELERLFASVADRANRKRATGGAGKSDGELMMEAAGELAAEARLAAAVEKRNAARNLAKRVGRRDFYDAAPAVKNLTGGTTPGPLIGLEAKLVGVNTPFAGSRLSVDAQGIALHSQLIDGLTVELDRAGLFEAMRGGQMEREWARELAEMSKPNGQPGISGSPHAQQIAAIVYKYQRMAVDAQNRAGAWIGDYDGYISRTTHDSDRIQRAGFETWRDVMLDKLDLERTFEGVDPADREGFLHGVYDALVTGVHLTQDGAQGFKDPAFKGPGNLSKKLSQSRTLHFRGADAWVDYNERFGSGTLAEGVLRSLETAARNAALMREFGTNPRAELEADIRWLQESRRGDHALQKALRNSQDKLHAFMDQLDGTSRQPVNQQRARIGAGVRAFNNLTRLGGVLASSISDVPMKSAELRYQGIKLAEGYADGMTSLARGRGAKGSETRDVMDLMRAGLEGMRGDLASRFDAADSTPGTLSKLSNTFFRWTGLKYWTDAQRAGAELVMSRHFGRQADRAWSALQGETRRLLTMFGVDEADWNRLRNVNWTQANGRRHLTPDMALKIPNVGSEYAQGLALKLYALYRDRGNFAVINPAARERALLLGRSRPGSVWGEAIRLLTQFKAFPAAVITKAWGREIYGGQGGYGAAGGIVHMLASSIVFGYAAMVAKDLAKGRTPRDPSDIKTWAAAFVQGGGAGIYGDFVVGEYSRFGKSLVSSLAGPTFSQIDDIAEIYNRVKARAMGERAEADVAATALRLALNNTPFLNLIYVRPVLDYLLLYQIQEALNPGFLRRFERRVEKENKQTFLLRPSSLISQGGAHNRLYGG